MADAQLRKGAWKRHTGLQRGVGLGQKGYKALSVAGIRRGAGYMIGITGNHSMVLL
jgi:hypothetical protein